MSCEVDDALVSVSTSSTLKILRYYTFNGYKKALMTILVSPIKASAMMELPDQEAGEPPISLRLDDRIVDLT